MDVIQYLQVPGRESFITPIDKPHTDTCNNTLNNTGNKNKNLYQRSNSRTKLVTSFNSTTRSNKNIKSSITLSSSNSNMTGNQYGESNTTSATSTAANNNNNHTSDKYTAAIELSNKCREFYNSRLEAANSFKSRWRSRDEYDDDNDDTTYSDKTGVTSSSHQGSNSTTPASKLSSSSSSSSSPSSSPTLSLGDSDGDVKEENENVKKRRPRNSIDHAMDRLRNEMVSLMEQDLSLMKQLLTLNETIEELKWQRQHFSCASSLTSSFSPSVRVLHWSPDARGSTCSVSDTEMYDSEEDDHDLHRPFPGRNGESTPSHCFAASARTTPGTVRAALSCFSSCSQSEGDKRSYSPSHALSTSPLSRCSGDLNNFDSESYNQTPVHPTNTTNSTEIVLNGVCHQKQQSRNSDRLSLDSLAARLEQATTMEDGDLTTAVLEALRDRVGVSGKNRQSTPLHQSNVTTSAQDPVRVTDRNSLKLTSDNLGLTTGPIVRHDRDQHSFDSGIHEPALSEELVWNV